VTRRTTETLCSTFQRTAQAHPERIALRTVGGGVEITWGEYARRVRSLAAGLAARGVQRGETLALMMGNRPEFALCDTAALHLGATPFSIYTSFAPEQVAQVLANAGSRRAIAERQYHERLRAADPALEVLDVEGLDALEDDPAFDFDAAWRAAQPGDVATLIYTSGTTGPPKGVELTHANVLAELRATGAVLPVRAEDRTTSYLPSAHIADRWMSHYQQMGAGYEVTFVADMRAIAAALPEVRPTVWGRGAARVGEGQERARGGGGRRSGRAAGRGQGGRAREDRPRPGSLAGLGRGAHPRRGARVLPRPATVHWGCGIGRELVRSAEELMRSRGVTTMQLELLVPKGWVHPEKNELQAWYMRLGYRVVRSAPFEQIAAHLAPQLAVPCEILIFQKSLTEVPGPSPR
jgi:GNAT superfamily N-acetyltransferase